jgi:pimeloyl-ACP methyl ester carboxylesterase
VVRVLLILAVAAAAAGAGWYFYSSEPPPDARLACHYGAYNLTDGRIVAIGPSTGPLNLRFVLMSGDTGWLKPIAPPGDALPKRFGAGPGWAGESPIRTQVEFGECSEGRISFAQDGAPAIDGVQRKFFVTETGFVSHGLTLAGRLVLPDGAGPAPVAVMVHGSERDSARLYNRFQHILPAHGVGVFVYDKRGTGGSEGSYSQDFHLLSDDAAAAMAKARELAGARGSEFGFEGGSQAGWIIPLATQKAKADFALVGYGLAESPLAEDREEVFDDLRTAGYGADVIAKAREITDATGAVMASGFKDSFDRLDAVRAKYGNEPWYAKIKGEYTGDFLSYPNWVLQFIGPWFDVGTTWSHDPVPPLNAVTVPHLWILAGRDSSAPSENTLRILREVQVDHPNLDIAVFPTADHGMTEFIEKDGERVDTQFSAGYFPLLIDWIKTKRAVSPEQGPLIYEGGAAAQVSPP